MSEEIKEMTNEEAMKALGEVATMCYNKGTQDVLIGVSIGAIFGVVIAVGFEVIELWKDKRKLRIKLKHLMISQRKRRRRSSNKGSFLFILD